MVVEQKRGHPPKSEVDKIRAVIWFAAVKNTSGLGNPYQLEKHFCGGFPRGLDGQYLRSCKWNPYASGQTCPSPSTVKQVEQTFPGTARWLTLPLWRVIADPPLEGDALLRSITDVRPTLRKRLVEGRRLLPQTFHSLEKEGGIEALTALLGIAVAAEQSGLEANHANAASAAFRIFLLLCSTEPFHSARHLFFNYLHDRYFSRTYKPGFTIGAQEMELDPAISAWRETLKLAVQGGFVGPGVKEQARFAYFVHQLGFSAFAIPTIAATWEQNRTGARVALEQVQLALANKKQERYLGRRDFHKAATLAALRRSHM